mgnify:CR=1 FL=1
MFYNWKQKFIDYDKMALSGCSTHNTNKQEQRSREIERLKKIIGEQKITIDAFKKTLETGRKG